MKKKKKRPFSFRSSQYCVALYCSGLLVFSSQTGWLADDDNTNVTALAIFFLLLLLLFLFVSKFVFIIVVVVVALLLFSYVSRLTSKKVLDSITVSDAMQLKPVEEEVRVLPRRSFMLRLDLFTHLALVFKLSSIYFRSFALSLSLS